MKDWKAAVRTWEQRNKDSPPKEKYQGRQYSNNELNELYVNI